MAHKKGVGSTDNGRDSNSKRLGVKIFGGQFAKAGNIIIRQRGTKYHAGENTYLGRDFTLHAAIDGTVAFRKRRQNRVYVSIIPENAEVEVASTPKVEKKTKKVAKETKVEAAPVMETAAPAPEVVEAPKAAKKATTKKADGKGDKLTKIEGIGPKIDSLLKEAGITTFAALSETDPEKIKEILLAAGSRYKMHNPTTWPKQAALAAADKWDELQEYQDRLDGGKEPTE